MRTFSNLVLEDLDKKDLEEKNLLEHLKQLYSKLPNKEKKSLPLSSLSTNEACVIGTSGNASELFFEEYKQNIHGQFLLLFEGDLEPKALKEEVAQMNIPIVFYMRNFSERRILELRLLGITTVSFPIEADWDKAAIQYSVEFGRDFGVESVLSVSRSGDLQKVQLVDCPVIMITPQLLPNCRDTIADTRSLMIEIRTQAEIDSLQPSPQKKWVAISYSNIFKDSQHNKESMCQRIFTEKQEST